MKSPFQNQNLRTLWDTTQNKYWLCAVDLIKMLTGNPYHTAKTYWRVYKHRNSYFNLDQGYQNTRLILPHLTNSKYYTMDVIDVATAIHIIKTIPHKNSHVYKCLLQLLGKANMVKRLNRFARKHAHQVAKQIKAVGQPIFFTVTKIEKYFEIGALRNLACT